MKAKIKITEALMVIFLLFALYPLSAYAAQKKYVWKTCTPAAMEHPGYQAQLEFAKLIKEKSNGQVEVKVYASSALGPMYDEFENVVRGTQEMGFLIPSPHFNKALQVVFMPYLVSTWEEGDKVYAPGGWMFELLKPLYADIGIELLGFSTIGMGGYASTKGPVVHPSDIKKHGIKTRVWCTADRLLFEPLGGTVSMPFADLYTALQTGVCHAQDNAAAATYQQLRDVTKYYSNINWNFEVFSVIMNKKLFDSLTPELQTAVQSSMSQALEKYNAVAKKEEMMYLQKLEDYGIKTTRLTPEQRKPWVEHGRSIWPKMKDECGEEIVDYVITKVK
jgi:TRAP-type C4-dicarboxylate transport system substrate-binding protein